MRLVVLKHFGCLRVEEEESWKDCLLSVSYNNLIQCM